MAHKLCYGCSKVLYNMKNDTKHMRKMYILDFNRTENLSLCFMGSIWWLPESQRLGKPFPRMNTNGVKQLSWHLCSWRPTMYTEL